jgi:hypothetical protein
MGFLTGKKTTTYVPTTTSTTAQAASDANKGATDAQKTKKELTQNYGQALQQTTQKYLQDSSLLSDTTLSSGSLLSLGSKLG